MRRLALRGRELGRHRAVRFVVVGGCNTLFGYAVYLAGLACGLRPELALALATAVGAVFNYFTTARFVFGHRAMNRLPAFIGAYALIYAVNALAIRILLGAGVVPALAQAMLVPAMAVLSFLIFRSFVFAPAVVR